MPCPTLPCQAASPEQRLRPCCPRDDDARPHCACACRPQWKPSNPPTKGSGHGTISKIPYVASPEREAEVRHACASMPAASTSSRHTHVGVRNCPCARHLGPSSCCCSSLCLVSTAAVKCMCGQHHAGRAPCVADAVRCGAPPATCHQLSRALSVQKIILFPFPCRCSSTARVLRGLSPSSPWAATTSASACGRPIHTATRRAHHLTTTCRCLAECCRPGAGLHSFVRSHCHSLQQRQADADMCLSM